MFHPAPPLPAAPPPLTDPVAERWLTARTAQRWDGRWLAVVPLLVCVVAMGQAARTPLLCGPAQPCGQSWAEDLIAVALLVEAVALAVRPRGLVLLPAALLPLIWYVPDGLPDEVSRWVALAAQAGLLVVLARAGLGRRAARQQLADLMGDRQPYPWTLAGAPAPELPRPVVRLVLGGLLLGLAAVSVAVGLERQADSDDRAARAEAVPGRVLSSDELGDTVVEYRLPGDHRPRTGAVDVYWDAYPKPGDTLPLLADRDGWVRPAGDAYDPTGWLLLATVLGSLGLVALGWAARSVRLVHHLGGPGAPVLRVVHHPQQDEEVVGPEGGGPLWRLETRQYLGWDGTCWVPLGTFPLHWEEEQERVHGPRTAWLYQAPDGVSAQVLVRRWTAHDDRDGVLELDWLAVVCTPQARVLRRPAPATARPTPDQGMPARLRLAVGPVAALVLGALVVLRAADGWWAGLGQPLLFGGFALASAVGALGWQARFDRQGLVTCTGLTRRRTAWADITGASAAKGRVTVRTTGEQELTIGHRAAEWLGLGDYDAAALADAVGRAAADPAARPATEVPEAAPELVVNRVALTAYLLTTVLVFATARDWLG
ncbi:hypothetical protein ACIRBX_29380 [Kitasatospora sp. NPDC096147]|uniref:hypothetical protein n=1 Tax=Kitasatospora sp. NPDC096147 TaxID=3364093 RepID=UPI0038082192